MKVTKSRRRKRLTHLHLTILKEEEIGGKKRTPRRGSRPRASTGPKVGLAHGAGPGVRRGGEGNHQRCWGWAGAACATCACAAR